MTNNEIAKRLGVSVSTLYNWKKDKSIFKAKLEEADIDPDDIEDEPKGKADDIPLKKEPYFETLIKKEEADIQKIQRQIEQLTETLYGKLAVVETLKEKFYTKNVPTETKTDAIDDLFEEHNKIHLQELETKDAINPLDHLEDIYEHETGITKPLSISKNNFPSKDEIFRKGMTEIVNAINKKYDEKFDEGYAKNIQPIVDKILHKKEPTDEDTFIGEVPTGIIDNPSNAVLMNPDPHGSGLTANPDASLAHIEPKKDIPLPEVEDEGYELYPKKPYDLYGIVFDETTKEDFLKIKRGEYWSQFEIRPKEFEGKTRQALTNARTRLIKETFDIKKFLEKPVKDQARTIFHLSYEIQLLLRDYLEDEDNQDKWLTGDEWDSKFNKFLKNFAEWRTLCFRFYFHFIVNPTTRDFNTCTGETVTAETSGIKKETVERWENLRLKWYDYLPKDIQQISFFDIAEYVLRENPDAWVNPETEKVEIRPPKQDIKPKGKIPYEESVRYMDDDELSANLDHYAELIKIEPDPERKAEFRRKGVIARNEMEARKVKYND